MLLDVLLFLPLIVKLEITLLKLPFIRDRISLRKILQPHSGPLAMEV